MITRSNNVYTIYLTQTLLPGTLYAQDFSLGNNIGQNKIKSIGFDLAVANSLNAQPENLNINETQNYWLLVGELTAIPVLIARTFNCVPAGGAAVFNGSVIRISRPGQFFFNNFFVQNILNLRFEHHNTDALITFDISATVIIEIEPT